MGLKDELDEIKTDFQLKIIASLHQQPNIVQQWLWKVSWNVFLITCIDPGSQNLMGWLDSVDKVVPVVDNANDVINTNLEEPANVTMESPAKQSKALGSATFNTSEGIVPRTVNWGAH